MKKILNIVLGEISTGELSIAISFEKSLDSLKYQSHFLIPEDKYMIMGERTQRQIFQLSRNRAPAENQRIVVELLEQHQYDLIILFDIFTFEYAQSWTGINCETLLKCNIPVMSLDEYEYTKAGYKLDYYGLFIKRLPPLLEKCDYIIKNCPMSMTGCLQDCLRQGNRNNEYYYRVFDQLKRISNKKKLAVRERYITKNKKEKVVLFTTSQWEVKGAYSFSCQNRLSEWLGVILHEYLKELNEDIVLVHVGNENWKLDKQEGKVRYLQYDFLPVDVFEEVLQSIDLYITFNLVSITLSKAVMFGIPSLVLNNSKIIDFGRLTEKLKERPVWYQQMAADVKKVYPFAASMFGWTNFLKKVIENNGYVDTFQRGELFQYKETVKLLQKLLYDQPFRQDILVKNEEFLKKYLELLSADEVLEDVFDQEKRSA